MYASETIVLFDVHVFNMSFDPQLIKGYFVLIFF